MCAHAQITNALEAVGRRISTAQTCAQMLVSSTEAMLQALLHHIGSSPLQEMAQEYVDKDFRKLSANTTASFGSVTQALEKVSGGVAQLVLDEEERERERTHERQEEEEARREQVREAERTRQRLVAQIDGWRKKAQECSASEQAALEERRREHALVRARDKHQERQRQADREEVREHMMQEWKAQERRDRMAFGVQVSRSTGACRGVLRQLGDMHAQLEAWVRDEMRCALLPARSRCSQSPASNSSIAKTASPSFMRASGRASLTSSSSRGLPLHACLAPPLTSAPLSDASKSLQVSILVSPYLLLSTLLLVLLCGCAYVRSLLSSLA
jgi:hypothetical protein